MICNAWSFVDLPQVILEIIISRFDFRDLVRLGTCCKYLQHLCLDDDDRFYQMVKKRWNVQSIRNRAIEADGFRGGHVYRNIYINWHQRNRMPTSPYSGQRFVRIASNMSKIGHVGQWCTLKSAADCRLHNHLLTLRTVVQNTTTHPVWVQLHTTELELQSGMRLLPASSKVVYLRDSGELDGRTAARSAEFDRETPLHNLYSFLVVESSFRFPPEEDKAEIIFEPEALERCHSLSIKCSAASIKDAMIEEDGCLPPSIVPICHFKGAEKLWDYFERLPGNAFVFNQEKQRQF
jgi:hypothetical protein